MSYRDEATGQELQLADLSLKTGRLDGQTPGDLAFSARITGKRPEVDLRAQAAGALRFNLGREEFGFDKFAAQVKGRIDQDTLAAEFSAPKVEVTPAKASGTDVKASILLKGPQRNVNAKLLISSVQGSATALTIPKVLIDLDAAAAGAAIKANLEASIKANLAKQDLHADVSGKLDDSALKAKIALTNFAPLKASFDVAIDRLNLDRYMPPDRKEAKSDDRVDLGALKGKTVSGKLAIGALTVKRAKLENVKAEIKLADGKLEVSPHTANLYGGTLSGSVTADANGNRISVKETAQNVARGRAAAGRRAEGRARGPGQPQPRRADRRRHRHRAEEGARRQRARGDEGRRDQGHQPGRQRAQREIDARRKAAEGRCVAEDRFLGSERELQDRRRRRPQ